MLNDMSVCTNLVMRFFRHLDDRNYEALCGLLAPDSLWWRQGKVLCGPADAHAALLQRSGTLRIAHIMTNLVVDEFSPQRCVMRGYLLVVRHDPGVVVSGPVRLDGLDSVRTMHIRTKFLGDQWLIDEINDDGLLFSRDA